jgi:hypothetical protein
MNAMAGRLSSPTQNVNAQARHEGFGEPCVDGSVRLEQRAACGFSLNQSVVIPKCFGSA